MTKRLFPALALFALIFSLAACSDDPADGSSEIIGAWKTVENGLKGKPYTLLIGEKTLVRDGGDDSINIVFKKEDDKILILNTKKGVAVPLIYTIAIIDKDTARVSDSWSTETYTRTTPEEIQRIAAMPRQK